MKKSFVAAVLMTLALGVFAPAAHANLLGNIVGGVVNSALGGYGYGWGGLGYGGDWDDTYRTGWSNPYYGYGGYGGYWGNPYVNTFSTPNYYGYGGSWWY